MIRLIMDTRILRILGFVDAALILSVLVLVGTENVATGYEMSIYDAYPGFFWGLLIAAAGIGYLIVLGASFSPAGRKSTWLLGAVPIVLADCILLFLPLIRGYKAYGYEDTLSHVGWIREIIANGTIGPSNPYPAEHLQVASLALVANIDSMRLTLAFPPVYTLFYTLGVILLAREILPRRGELIVASMLASLLPYGFYHLMFAPYPQSFFVIPFILFLYFREKRCGSKHGFLVGTLPLLLLLVFFHAFSVLFLASILIIMERSRAISRSFSIPSGSDVGPRSRFGESRNVVFMLLVSFFAWTAWINGLVGGIRGILLKLAGEDIATEFHSYSESIQSANASLGQVAITLVNVYGTQILFISISLYGTYLLVLRAIRRKGEFVQAFAVMGFSFFLVVYGVVFLLASNLGSPRIFLYVGLFSTILIAAAWSVKVPILSKAKRRDLLVLSGIALVMLLLVISSIITLYWAPRNREDNLQVTDSDYQGMTFFFEERNQDIPAVQLGISQTRYFEAIYGRDTPKPNLIYGKVATPPIHFGYDNNSSIADTYEAREYLLVNDRGKEYWPLVWPDFPSRWVYSPADFSRLENDSGVQAIFSNGNVRIFLTSPT